MESTIKDKYKELIIQAIHTNPLVLLNIEDTKTITMINSYLPFSTAFEIECSKAENFQEECFSFIPNIMDVDITEGEQRFRLPNGIKGMICLYMICEQLKENSLLNLGSGIHYHVDVSYVKERPLLHSFIHNNKGLQKQILSELDTWRYKGTYNYRKVAASKGNWVRAVTGYGTIEYRIGEMTFDYELIIKRILHVNAITRNIVISSNIIKEIPDNTETCNKELVIGYYKDNKSSFHLAKLDSLNSQLKILRKQMDEEYKKKDYNLAIRGSNDDKRIIESKIIKI